MHLMRNAKATKGTNKEKFNIFSQIEIEINQIMNSWFSTFVD